jgi:broad specificity phosphatase PhoE
MAHSRYGQMLAIQQYRAGLEEQQIGPFGLDGEYASELMLVRHAETACLHPDAVEYARGPRLSRTGVEQSRRMARRLSDLWVEHIYFAPEQATEETAAILSDVTRRPASCLPHLRDLGSDCFSGKKRLEDGCDDPDRELERSPVRLTGDHESWGSFRLRVLIGLDSVLERHPALRIVVVTHGNVINAYLSAILETPREKFLEPNHTSISTVRAIGDTRALKTLNDTSHLHPHLAEH